MSIGKLDGSIIHYERLDPYVEWCGGLSGIQSDYLYQWVRDAAMLEA